MSLSRTILGLLFLATSAMVTGGATQPPGTSGSGAAPSSVVEPPVFCLLEKNHGTCVTCCMEATGAPAWACSRFCKNVVPPTPGPDPEP
jgi:hypothetical protein